MKVKTKTPEEVRQAGLEALSKALGAVGMIRFLQLFEKGKGDYTREREKWLGRLSLKDVVTAVKKARKSK